MADSVTIKIEGLSDLRKALRAAADGSPKEITKALKPGATRLASTARSLAPHRSGKLAASIKPFARGTSAGAQTKLPYAGVMEWATTYHRGGRRPGEVTLVNVEGSPPRYLNKARDEVAPKVVDDLFKALIEIASAHGWLEPE